MTEDQALDLADKLLVLINSQPRTPSRLEIAALIMRERPVAKPIVAEGPELERALELEYRAMLCQGRKAKEERDHLYWTAINDLTVWSWEHWKT